MKIAGLLSLDGSLISNGVKAKLQNGGGASGGSIYLKMTSFVGLGMITANGGDGLGTGHGGGGGCIAIHVDDVVGFKGRFQSFGGNGKIIGGAGTVYSEDNKIRIPRLVIN